MSFIIFSILLVLSPWPFLELLQYTVINPVSLLPLMLSYMLGRFSINIECSFDDPVYTLLLTFSL